MNAAHTDQIIPNALYVLLAGTLGLLFAIDICRRDERTQNPANRAMTFIAVFVAFPLVLPVAVISWWRWRRTLKLQARFGIA